jgi:hypothetical protein
MLKNDLDHQITADVPREPTSDATTELTSIYMLFHIRVNFEYILQGLVFKGNGRSRQLEHQTSAYFRISIQKKDLVHDLASQDSISAAVGGGLLRVHMIAVKVGFLKRGNGKSRPRRVDG